MPIRKYIEDPNRPKPAPVEYAGQWVAWDPKRTRVIAHSAIFDGAVREAIAVGCTDPLLERVRHPDERILGLL
jgi:hypothetical protein